MRGLAGRADRAGSARQGSCGPFCARVNHPWPPPAGYRAHKALRFGNAPGQRACLGQNDLRNKGGNRPSSRTECDPDCAASPSRYGGQSTEGGKAGGGDHAPGMPGRKRRRWIFGSRLRFVRGSGVFFYFDGVGRNHFAREDEVAFIGNGPLNILSFGEIHGLGDGAREVDVPLLTFLALNELNFGGLSHMG